MKTALPLSEQEQLKERFLKAQEMVYRATAAIPEEEIEALIATAIKESRIERAKKQVRQEQSS